MFFLNSKIRFYYVSCTLFLFCRIVKLKIKILCNVYIFCCIRKEWSVSGKCTHFLQNFQSAFLQISLLSFLLSTLSSNLSWYSIQLYTLQNYVFVCFGFNILDTNKAIRLWCHLLPLTKPELILFLITFNQTINLWHFHRLVDGMQSN